MTSYRFSGEITYNIFALHVEKTKQCQIPQSSLP